MGKCISPNEKEIEQLRTPLTEGEKEVLDIFKEKTSDEWEIYVQPHLNGSRPDFILLNPNIGIGVFEVKDWKIESLQFKNKILKLNGKLKENPVTKLYNYKDKIHNLYCPRLYAKRGYAAITAGLIFPNISEKDLNLIIDDLDSYSWIKAPPFQTLSGKETVEKKNIGEIFPGHSRKTSQLMKPEYADDLRNWFIEPDYSKEQRNKIILDKNQLQIVNSRTETGYRKIRGSSGSGKSLVLIERANKILSEDENKKILFINFNITLCQYLRDLCSRQRGDPRKINFLHFHQWLKETFRVMGLMDERNKILSSYLEKGDDEAVEKYTPDLCKLILKNPNTEIIEKYDAIFVDEGQDFELLWWQCLRKSLKVNGEMYLAADINQDIYNHSKYWTEESMKGAGLPASWLQLKISYRLPTNVIPFVKKFMEFWSGDFNADYIPEEQKQLRLLETCKIKWIQTDYENIEMKCFKELMNLIKEDDKSERSFTDLTYITDNEDIGLRIKNILESKKIECIDTYDEKKYNNQTNYNLQKRKKCYFYKGAERIKLTTLHSFKGWEGRMILVNINKAENIEHVKLIYTALTRVKAHPEKSFLHIICTNSKLQKFAENYNNDENYEFKIL